MAGNSSIQNNQTVTYTDNMSFDGTSRGGAMTTDGQLWIGSTASNRANDGGHVRLGSLTGGAGVSIVNGPGTITISVSGATVGQTITGDTGGALSPTAGNWNILGQQAGTVAVMDTIGSVSTLSIEDRTWLTFLVVDSSTTVGLRGTFSTIASALTAAVSGQTIYLRSGTYTENLTLKAGVNLAAFDCDAETPNVTIVGKCTYTGAGTVTLSGIRLQTNGDFFLSCTGNAASIVKLKNCFLNCSNNTGIEFTSTGADNLLQILSCQGSFGTTGITMWTKSSTGEFQITHSDLYYGSATSTVSSHSAGLIRILHCNLNFPIGCTGTGFFFIQHSSVETNNAGVTSITLAGSATSLVTLSRVNSAGAVAISIATGAGLKIIGSTVESSNATAAIDGAGTIQYTDINFDGSSSIITTTTQTPLYTNLGKYKSSGQPRFSAYLASADANVTGDGTNFTLGSATALTELFDIGSNFNTNGTFTAPVTGYYHFCYGVLGQQAVATMTADLALITTATNYIFGNYGTILTGNFPMSDSRIVFMTAGDTATVRVNFGNGTKVVDIYGGAGDPRTFFSGTLIG